MESVDYVCSSRLCSMNGICDWCTYVVKCSFVNLPFFAVLDVHCNEYCLLGVFQEPWSETLQVFKCSFGVFLPVRGKAICDETESEWHKHFSTK